MEDRKGEKGNSEWEVGFSEGSNGFSLSGNRVGGLPKRPAVGSV